MVNVSAASGASVKVAKVRFNCLRALWEPIHLVSIELRVKQVPWEGTLPPAQLLPAQAGQ